ncbi:MAG: SDR family oxidoreductase [Chloroflexi bacterium]|nr:SDR family oxidoreductase [Chloroflexota bacterium]
MTQLVPGAALITGGGSGIGRAVALALAGEGAPIAILDLRPTGGEETVGLIEAAGGRAAYVPADVRHWDEVDRAFAEAVAAVGPLGIVVNAAGILDGYAQADAVAPAVWDRVIGINLTGTFWGCKRALDELLPRGGRIINIASTAGLVGDGGGPAYVASKHGVVGLTRQLAVAYAERGVTVNAICPGPIATPLRANSTQILGADAPPMGGIGGDPSRVRAIVPAGRYGTVEEIAALIVFLASIEAGYITGQTQVIDGGWTAR